MVFVPLSKSQRDHVRTARRMAQKRRLAQQPRPPKETRLPGAMRDAFDKALDPNVTADLERAALAAMHCIFLQHGPEALLMPRHLAVCHEVGHVIVATTDGVTIAYVEVTGQTVAPALAKIGFPPGDLVWVGFTRFADSPFPLDMPGRPVDIVKLDFPLFQHAVRMELGGIAGEHVLYDGDIPAASSLDERILSQHACAMRARGNTEIAKITWRDLFKETCSTIEQNRETAGELIAAFENKDRLEGPELQEVLNKRRLH